MSDTRMVLLRPGATVEAVDEGLLFSGWQGSTLMRCQPGVAKVWRAVEPIIRGGFDADALRERLPEQARRVCDVLVQTLQDNEMLAPVGVNATELSPAQARTLEYLAHSAPDPGAAAELLVATTVRVLGAPEHVAALTESSLECGIRVVADDADTGSWHVYAGDEAEFEEVASARSDLIAAAVAASDTIVVGPCDAGVDRMRAAVELLTSHSTPVPSTPSLLTWTIARTVLIECVHRLLAGTSRPDRGFLVDATGSREVPLAPPRHHPRPQAHKAVEWRPREDTELLTRLEPVSAERIGQFPAPTPGTLVQHPLARQTVSDVHGAGVDQARAGADAVLGFLRREASSLGEHPVAGDGPADLLADVVGRLAVAAAEEPDVAWAPATPLSRRWVQAVLRLSGQPAAIATTHSRGAVVARATAAGHTSWGYGADAETAGEHAVRGLLKALVADLSTDPRSVVISHESTAALPLLAATLDIHDGDEPRVESLLNSFGVRLLDLGGGLTGTGLLVGTAEGRQS